MRSLFAEREVYVMPIRPTSSEGDFYLPFELASLLESGPLRRGEGGTDHDILMRFARNVLLEHSAGLAGLPETAQRALTYRPRSISVWWSSQKESYDAFDGPPGLTFDQTRKLEDYLRRRESLQATSSSLTEDQVLQKISSLDGVVFKAPYPEDQGRSFDTESLLAYEETTYLQREVDLLKGDTLVLMTSALFDSSAFESSFKGSRLVNRIDGVLKRLVSTSPSSIPATRTPRLVVTDKPFVLFGMSGQIFGLVSDIRTGEIQISPALLRAIPARCASSGLAVMILLQAREAAEYSPSLYDNAEAGLIASLERKERDSKPIVEVTLQPLLPRPASLSPGQMSDARIKSFVDDYWSCIERSMEFPLAHELAHISLQLKCDGDDACELRADCYALTHLESLERADEPSSDPGRLGVFFEFIVQSIRQGHPDFVVRYQEQTEGILWRYAKMEAGACRRQSDNSPHQARKTDQGGES